MAGTNVSGLTANWQGLHSGHVRPSRYVELCTHADGFISLHDLFILPPAI